MEMLTEYAFGATVGKHVGYLNFLLQITPNLTVLRGVTRPSCPT